MPIFAMQMKKTENPLQQGVLPYFLFKTSPFESQNFNNR